MVSCKPDPMEASISMSFGFTYRGQPMRFDTVVYEIASGEKITVDNIQFFISDVYLVDHAGIRTAFADAESNIHYVDTDIPETWTWVPDEGIPTGVYEYVEFVYGIDSAKNRSYLFRNPPESNMFWPEYMGGGYHYMKLNGYWGLPGAVSCDSTFGFHAGIGQTYRGETVVAYHQNYVPLRDTLRLFLAEGSRQELKLNMEVSQWFENPNLWRFSYFGGHVMKNQEAQQAIKENAWNVFSLNL